MSKTKQTPAPWVANENGEIFGQQGEYIAVIGNPEDEPNGIDMANAHLIAAAPEMLDALEVVADQLEILAEAVRRGIKPNPDSIASKGKELLTLILKAKGVKA